VKDYNRLTKEFSVVIVKCLVSGIVNERVCIYMVRQNKTPQHDENRNFSEMRELLFFLPNFAHLLNK